MQEIKHQQSSFIFIVLLVLSFSEERFNVNLDFFLLLYPLTDKRCNSLMENSSWCNNTALHHAVDQHPQKRQIWAMSLSHFEQFSSVCASGGRPNSSLWKDNQAQMYCLLLKTEQTLLKSFVDFSLSYSKKQSVSRQTCRL